MAKAISTPAAKPEATEAIQGADVSNIYTAINRVMRDIGAVGKAGENKEQKYNFRAIDDVYNALHPALVKHGVFITPTIIDRHVDILETEKYDNYKKTNYIQRSYHAVLTVKFRFNSVDGSFVEAQTVGEGIDYSDKALNKAMSGAFKYACFQVFAIPTREMLIDSETETLPIGSAPAPKSAPAAKPQPAAAPDYHAEAPPETGAPEYVTGFGFEAEVEEISRLLKWIDIEPALSVTKFRAIEAGNDQRRAEFLRNVRKMFIKTIVTGEKWALSNDETIDAFNKIGLDGIDNGTDEQLVKAVDWVAATAFNY